MNNNNRLFDVAWASEGRILGSCSQEASGCLTALFKAAGKRSYTRVCLRKDKVLTAYDPRTGITYFVSEFYQD